MQQRGRATFDAAELAVVLSYFDLGTIESITEFKSGSSRSPKVGIVSERGKFILKRRAAERARLDRVHFAHQVQTQLAGEGFPLPRLIKTRGHNGTYVQLREHIYELFEFIPGQPYQRTVVEARDAGIVLAQFHQATEEMAIPPNVLAPRGDYHDNPGVRTGLGSIETNLSSHESFTGNLKELSSLVQDLIGCYDRAAEKVNRLGYSSRPERIVHLDWHPGNLLFRRQRVVAVIDYDSVRRSRRVLDAANGALQFSIIAGGDPAHWPDGLDEERYHGFRAAYESLFPLSSEERFSIPYLMVEALIAECVLPITQTGAVGRWAGFRVLQMVLRKVRWFVEHASVLTQVDTE